VGDRADQDLVENSAQAINIGPLVYVLTQPLFRRHVGWRVRTDPTAGQLDGRLAADLRQSKIGEQGTTFTQENIAGLNIPVDDLPLIGIVQGLGNLDDIINRLLPVQTTAIPFRPNFSWIRYCPGVLPRSSSILLPWLAQLRL
jgi:hypothetical protein